ncbi:MAG TPA: hypothetical protein VKG43_03520 [Acidimicrobiales bacterium]|nr:hypothetical protein [Acidimicrobiales bacterium]
MARQRSTLGKLQRDQAKRDKAKAKQEDRLARREGRTDDQVATATDVAEDQTALLEQFARLHDDLAEGRVSLEDFETRQEELRSRLRVD